MGKAQEPQKTRRGRAGEKLPCLVLTEKFVDAGKRGAGVLDRGARFYVGRTLTQAGDRQHLQQEKREGDPGTGESCKGNRDARPPRGKALDEKKQAARMYGQQVGSAGKKTSQEKEGTSRRHETTRRAGITPSRNPNRLSGKPGTGLVGWRQQEEARRPAGLALDCQTNERGSKHTQEFQTAHG